MSLAELIQRRRADLGMSQVELGIKADTSQRTVSEIERGVRRRPQLHTLRAFADALEMPLAELVLASGQADDLAEAARIAEEVRNLADQDPKLTALLLAAHELDESAVEILLHQAELLRANQRAIEKRFKQLGE
jgi:transcriptional regulator with XRE-family HTH domain